MKTERINSIDFAKGIGIIAVIIGHITTFYIVSMALYSFHLPGDDSMVSR